MYFYVWTCYTAKQVLVAPLSHFVVKTIPSLPAKVKTDVKIRQLKEQNLLLHLSKALCEACYHNFGTNILAQVIWDLRWLHGQKYILTTCGMANIGRLQHRRLQCMCSIVFQDVDVEGCWRHKQQALHILPVTAYTASHGRLAFLFMHCIDVKQEMGLGPMVLIKPEHKSAICAVFARPAARQTSDIRTEYQPECCALMCSLLPSFSAYKILRTSCPCLIEPSRIFKIL